MIDLEFVLSQQEPRIRRGFLQMVANMEGELSLAQLEILIEQGRLEEALNLVLRSAPNLATASGAAFLAGAQHVAQGLGKELGAIVIDFDQTNQFAMQAMRDNNLSLVQQFTEGQRQATRQAIVDGIQEGVNPRQQARAFKESIGLSPAQQRALRNYRRALEGLSADALRNKLRDHRSDGVVGRAIRDGDALSAGQIDSLVERYRKRLLAHRASVIARTEALRSVHEGADASLQQAIDRGDLEFDQIIREWFTAKDERVRGTHRTMHRQKRAIGEPFVSGGGVLLMRPGDSRAPAKEVIQCRCRMAVRITVPEPV